VNGNNNQPTYKRQRFLLAFIRQLHGSVSSTDLQKLVFINAKTENSDYYEFLPYKYGSYSFQLAEDLEILERDGYIITDSLPKSTKIIAVGKYKSETAFQIAAERGDDLIRKAYLEYPYYAIKSEIAERVLCDEELKQLSHKKQQYIKAEQVLFTIGYEGNSIEAFINTLIKNDIRLLCDVRKNPLSRKFGFSKGKLKHISETVGIKYVHIPDLGIDSDKRSSLETLEDYKCLFDNYEKTLSSRILFLEYVHSLLQSNTRIALMCYEQEAEMCHRHIIKDYIHNAYNINCIDL